MLLLYLTVSDPVKVRSFWFYDHKVPDGDRQFLRSSFFRKNVKICDGLSKKKKIAIFYSPHWNNIAMPYRGWWCPSYRVSVFVCALSLSCWDSSIFPSSNFLTAQHQHFWSIPYVGSAQKIVVLFRWLTPKIFMMMQFNNQIKHILGSKRGNLTFWDYGGV